MKWDFDDVTSMMRDGKFQIKLYDMKTRDEPLAKKRR